MLKGHGIYPTGDSHEQRRHSWFSKSRAAPTAPEIRLGLGMGSTFRRGYSGTTFNIGSDSACLIVIQRTVTHTERVLYITRVELTVVFNTQGNTTDTEDSRNGINLKYFQNFCSPLKLANSPVQQKTEVGVIIPEAQRITRHRNHTLVHNTAYSTIHLCSTTLTLIQIYL